MAMTGAGLWAARKSAIAGVAAVQSSDPAAVAAYRDAIGIAESQAIIDYIKANMGVQSSGTDPQGGTVTSNSTLIT